MKLHNKASKRMPARKRYRIEKKVREHNRKIKKEAKHSKKKSKMMQVPNQCPFKEDILKEIEAMRKQQQEEKQKQKEAARGKKREQLAKGDLKVLVNQAQNKQLAHESMQIDSARDQIKNAITKEENSLKAYYKEFKKVLDAADIILEVMDARDPLGTRCKEVEKAVISANKRLVLVLNKADLIPRENLDQWLKYLRVSLPAVAFKSSTQNQANRLGRRKLGKKTESMIQSNTCFGAELLLSLLGNYCRNSSNVKTSITVGVVGLPNVGKSSVINSLKRSKACNVGNIPGITKTMQVVQLDSKIKLLDSPGIVFATSDEKSDDMSVALKNAVKIQALKDPFTPATAILKRVSRQQIMELYNMQEFSTPDEFFAMKAARMGKYRKGGVPDGRAAARSILEDWNSGKIRYYTVPPEQPICHISAEIVSQIAKEFDIENFATEEKMMLDNFTTDSTNNPTIADPVLIDSSGPVTAAMEIEIQKESEFKVQKKLKKKLQDTKKDVSAERKKKPDPLFEIEGNQKLNKLRKLKFKKEKKERAKREKATAKLAGQLEDFKFTTDDYDFNTDFAAT
ncbi:guanine nucleotide-binding protein-like 3 homolog isoform X2 [Formica exsecta]|uniref:guanine nucleotide-binding protein-like 3 homolog isoform X1 n=1 Tax=Formica exsecta TaxID=72781 RepID=UPI001141A4B4|nr:guanine nucleotide-binding protein-like 3 homolog isoform X1 [Formica exsecta]XP_029678222.1 guanine nucleotide-binding protein-like 3 homolog isoform X2 [Formica exsecta]